MFGSVIQERGVPSWISARRHILFGFSITTANEVQSGALGSGGLLFTINSQWPRAKEYYTRDGDPGLKKK
jgi:hypothetical protein